MKKFSFLLLIILFTLLCSKGIMAGEIHDTIQNQDFIKIKLLLKKNPSLVNQKDKYKFTPLHLAAKTGNTDIINLLIKNGADVNAKGYSQNTPIFYSKNAATVKTLMKAGADIEARDGYKNTPLLFLVELGNTGAVKYLINNGAKLEVVNSLKYTPLMVASEKGKKEIARFLIDKGVNLEKKGLSGFTALMLAVNFSKKDIVKILLDAGANPNCRDERDETPLHKVRDVEIAKLLIKKGADVNAKSKTGRTPIFNPVLFNNIKLIKLFVSQGADVNARDNDNETPLLCSTSGREKDAVELLLNNGADIEARENTFGLTPLLSSVFWLHSEEGEIPILLINRGSDITKTDKKGNTALHLAADKFLSERVVVSLLLKGANDRVKNIDGKTPLDIAKSKKRKENILLLTSKGKLRELFCHAVLNDFKNINRIIKENPDIINTKNSDGISPLHFAAITENLKLAKLLVDKGVKVDTRDNKKRTPLYWAARESCPEIVDFLVKKGADVNAVDSEGFTPLHCVARWSGCHRSKKMTEILLKAGAKPEARDTYGRTPLHWAAFKNTDKVFDLLLSKGVDVDIKDKDGKTAGFLAILNGNEYLAKELYQKSKKKTDPENPKLLYKSALKGDKEAVEKFLDKYPGLVNARFNGKPKQFSRDLVIETPLHAAAKKGHLYVVDLLVTKYKANINAKDNDGFTPLILAIYNGNESTAKLLIEKGANIKPVNFGPQYIMRQATSPLHEAVEKGYLKIVELLLKKGADPNLKINDKTPLDLAREYNHRGIVELFIKYGARKK